ncbi:uncharacterized protein G2W53_001329 [Senna tora]|uniref:Uncharacterized protein n=1 Tax=Senna tora TaxID=362788 RepID=A0A835CJB2_9FABA|nr:uncharacterized protein G2W53_001329 [Senna tora]
MTPHPFLNTKWGIKRKAHTSFSGKMMRKHLIINFTYMDMGENAKGPSM